MQVTKREPKSDPLGGTNRSDSHWWLKLLKVYTPYLAEGKRRAVARVRWKEKPSQWIGTAGSVQGLERVVSVTPTRSYHITEANTDAEDRNHPPNYVAGVDVISALRLTSSFISDPLAHPILEGLLSYAPLL